MYCKIEKVKSFGRRYYCTLFLKDNTIGKRLKSEPIKNIPCDEYDEIIGYAITVDF
jgi:hypothetical protein